MNPVFPDKKRAIRADKVPEKADWYVYYRVRVEQEAALHTCVVAMQRSLLALCGVTGSLKRRPQQRDGLHTWMEVYLDAPTGFDSMLAAETQRAKLSDLIEGERHVEHFWDVTICA